MTDAPRIRPLIPAESKFVMDELRPHFDGEQAKLVAENLRALVAEGKRDYEAEAEVARDLLVWSYESDDESELTRTARLAWNAIAAGTWREEPPHRDELEANAADHSAWLQAHEPRDRHGGVEQCVATLPEIVIENTIKDGVGVLRLGGASYLVVGLDQSTFAPWHQNVGAFDVATAKQVAFARARARGIQLALAAVIGPHSTVLADPVGAPAVLRQVA